MVRKSDGTQKVLHHSASFNLPSSSLGGLSKLPPPHTHIYPSPSAAERSSLVEILPVCLHQLVVLVGRGDSR